MIPINRGPEPAELRKVRLVEVPRIKAIARAKHPLGPTSDEIGTKYRVVADQLWRAQHAKCAFCEARITKAYNDVEHRRAKATCDRRPGSTETHGYWWLAFTWENLVFCCPVCNRTYKRIQFPLAVGSVALAVGEHPPKREIPLLLDPAEVNGVEHIEFVFAVMNPRPPVADRPPGWPERRHWHARARGGSPMGVMGQKTVDVCGLNDGDLVEIYDMHVDTAVRPIANALNEAIVAGRDVDQAFQRALALLDPRGLFVGLSYDALRALVPAASLTRYKLAWPAPERVGHPRPRRRR